MQPLFMYNDFFLKKNLKQHLSLLENINKYFKNIKPVTITNYNIIFQVYLYNVYNMYYILYMLILIRKFS